MSYQSRVKVDTHMYASIATATNTHLLTYLFICLMFVYHMGVILSHHPPPQTWNLQNIQGVVVIPWGFHLSWQGRSMRMWFCMMWLKSKRQRQYSMCVAYTTVHNTTAAPSYPLVYTSEKSPHDSLYKNGFVHSCVSFAPCLHPTEAN